MSKHLPKAVSRIVDPLQLVPKAEHAVSSGFKNLMGPKPGTPEVPGAGPVSTGVSAANTAQDVSTRAQEMRQKAAAANISTSENMGSYLSPGASAKRKNASRVLLGD